MAMRYARLVSGWPDFCRRRIFCEAKTTDD